MAAGDVTDGEGHGEDGEAEGEGDPGESDAKLTPRSLMVSGGEHGGSAASEDEPEGPEHFGDCTFGEVDEVTCSFL